MNSQALTQSARTAIADRNSWFFDKKTAGLGYQAVRDSVGHEIDCTEIHTQKEMADAIAAAVGARVDGVDAYDTEQAIHHTLECRDAQQIVLLRSPETLPPMVQATADAIVELDSSKLKFVALGDKSGLLAHMTQLGSLFLMAPPDPLPTDVDRPPTDADRQRPSQRYRSQLTDLNFHMFDSSKIDKALGYLSLREERLADPLVQAAHIDCGKIHDQMDLYAAFAEALGGTVDRSQSKWDVEAQAGKLASRLTERREIYLTGVEQLSRDLQGVASSFLERFSTDNMKVIACGDSRKLLGRGMSHLPVLFLNA